MICKKKDIDEWKNLGIYKLLNVEPRYHRKYWEYGFLIKNLIFYNLFKKGKNGIVFGCGEEITIPAIANAGVSVTATDQPATGEHLDWALTNQHCKGTQTFDKFNFIRENLIFKKIDMNNLPNIKNKYDFLWSLCSLEHLGSLEKSHQFIINSLNFLKPGGIAIHTTEFNYKENLSRDDSKNCVFSKFEIEQLFFKLKGFGHKPFPLDYTMGDSPEDYYVDKFPFSNDLHLKLFAEGYYITSIGFVIKSNENKLL